MSVDVMYQHVDQAISVVNPLLGPASLTQSYQSTTDSINTHPIDGANLIGTANTEYGIVTNNRAIMVAAKYGLGNARLFAGYEHILYRNPAHPLGVGASAQGGYLLSGVEDENLDSAKKIQVLWTGGRYAVDPKSDLALSYYREIQNDFRSPSTCSVAAGFRSSCAGTLNEVSFYGDHHFTPHFDTYAGIAWSNVTGGLAIAIPHGPGVPYFHDTNTAPTVGARFAF